MANPNTGDAHKRHSLTVPLELSGERLDRAIVALLPELTRSRIQALIRSGSVEIAGHACSNANHKVKAGDQIVVAVPPAVDAEPAGEHIALSVVFEDADVIVIDKPAGLVVHPAAGHSSGTLVNALIAHCGASLSGIGGVRRPGIVHRLDKDTSGLLVVAKNDAAHQALSEQFASHGLDGQLKRTYEALVWGVPNPAKGKIDLPLSRSTTNRTKIAVARGDGGRHAVTHYDTAEVYAGKVKSSVASRVRLTLETGRTHQIRVHMAEIGHPLLGDSVYGAGYKASANTLPEAAQAALQSLGRQALHAAELGFVHPKTGKHLHFTSPLPPDLAMLVSSLKPGAST